jgi:hypothetical protein
MSRNWARTLGGDGCCLMLVCQVLRYLNEEAKGGFNIGVNNIYGDSCYLALGGLQVYECFVEVCGVLFQIRP